MPAGHDLYKMQPKIYAAVHLGRFGPSPTLFAELALSLPFQMLSPGDYVLRRVIVSEGRFLGKRMWTSLFSGREVALSAFRSEVVIRPGTVPSTALDRALFANFSLRTSVALC